MHPRNAWQPLQKPRHSQIFSNRKDLKASLLKSHEYVTGRLPTGKTANLRMGQKRRGELSGNENTPSARQSDVPKVVPNRHICHQSITDGSPKRVLAGNPPL